LNTINNTLSLLSKPSKNKFNIGTPCKVEKGGFVGLGIVKLKYRLWYYFFVIINKLGINKGNKDRFKFYWFFNLNCKIKIIDANNYNKFKLKIIFTKKI